MAGGSLMLTKNQSAPLIEPDKAVTRSGLPTKIVVRRAWGRTARSACWWAMPARGPMACWNGAWGFIPHGKTQEQIVRMAGTRWTIASGIEAAKREEAGV
jgi:hypothetical protein